MFEAVALIRDSDTCAVSPLRVVTVSNGSWGVSATEHWWCPWTSRRGLGADIPDGGKWLRSTSYLRMCVGVGSSILCLLWCGSKQRREEVSFMWGTGFHPALQCSAHAHTHTHTHTHTPIARPPVTQTHTQRSVLRLQLQITHTHTHTHNNCCNDSNQHWVESVKVCVCVCVCVFYELRWRSQWTTR